MFGNLFKKSSSRSTSSEKKLVARYARGNVSLQQGKYSTAKTAAKRRKEILSHTFV